MKIRFVKNTDVDIFKQNMNEVHPKYFYKHEELPRVESISDLGNVVDIVLYNGDVIQSVPKNHFEII